MKKLVTALVFLLASSCSTFKAWQHEDILEPPERRLTWQRDQIPLLVMVDPGVTVLKADWGTAEAKAAIDDINDRVGCTVLRLVPSDMPRYDVLLESAPLEALPGNNSELFNGETFGLHMGQPNQTAVSVLYGGSSSLEATLVIYHELGHALGLAHDLRSRSIMMPGVSDAADGPMPYPHLSDRAAKVLHQLYCPAKQ